MDIASATADSTNTVVVPATQVIGNGSDGGYLWEMVPTTNPVKTFNNPININNLSAPHSG